MKSDSVSFARVMAPLALVALLAGTGCNDGDGAEAVTGCRATAMHINLRSTQADGSFSHHYSGTVDLTFDPAPQEYTVVFCVLNSGSIQGTKTIEPGTVRTTVPMEGNAVADVFSIQPSRLDVFDKTTMIKIGSFDFNWD